ncbi:MAG: PAS domain S-box protein, partial [Candidatus Omnitrophica bacterium]|nr:PAS domain S-box protein [Candidatus Omnitrophota bacterium]
EAGSIYTDAVTQKALKAKGRIIQSYKANPRELIYDFSDPIDGLGGERIGVIRIGVRSAIIDKEISRIRNQALGIGIIFIIIACVSVFFLSNFTILAPIRNLMLGVSKIGSGEFDRGIELKTKDEFGELAKAFNNMAEDLKKSTVSIEVLCNEQKRFHDVAESSEEWIWEIDIKGWYVYSSPMVEKILGYKPQEIYGRYFYDFYHPDDRQETKEKVFAAFSREEISRNFLTRNIRKDGRVVMLEASSIPILDKDGKLIGYRGSTRDITGREKIKQELKEAKDYAELLFELVPSAVFVVDKNRRVISWNKKAQEITGYSAEEIKAKECLLFSQFPCNDGCGLYSDDVKKPIIGKECTIKTKDGRLRIILKNVDVLKDEKGDVIGGIESFNDITDIKLAEEALRESEEKYRDLWENVNDLIQSVTPEGSFVYVNKAWKETLGYSEEEVSTLSLFNIIHPDSQAHCVELFKRLMSGEKIEQFEVMFLTRNGETIMLEGSANCRFVDGKPVVTRTILRDITERKKAEEALINAKEAADTANRAKSDFLANMSHELRTPLNAVIGFSEVLTDESFGPLGDKQKEYIHDIWESGKHLLSLINDILDLSKVEAGKMELELIEFDLKTTLEAGLSMIKEKAMRQDITIFEDIKDDIGAIHADERKVKQIMFNLLSNAAKFTPEGGKIGIEAKNTENNEILITVWDTGIGIEEKDKAKVFNAFEQIDSSLSRKYSGTGLGMPLAKKLVELHGGKFWFESEGAGRGSRFSFTLPRDIPEKILYRSIENRISAARKKNKELSVVVIHFNNYSRIESILGNEQAQGFLARALRVCENIVKSEDLVMQMGKDEIIILGEVSKKDAFSVTMRLKKEIKGFIFQENADINFSYGFAIFPYDGDNNKDLLAKAIKNLTSEGEERR